MRWIAASILFSAVLVSYAITLPYRECVNGFVAQNGGDSSVGAKRMAAIACKIKG